MKNPWLWESLAVAPPAAFDITCNSVGVRASLTDTFGVNLVARYTQSVLGAHEKQNIHPRPKMGWAEYGFLLFGLALLLSSIGVLLLAAAVRN